MMVVVPAVLLLILLAGVSSVSLETSEHKLYIVITVQHHQLDPCLATWCLHLLLPHASQHGLLGVCT